MYSSGSAVVPSRTAARSRFSALSTLRYVLASHRMTNQVVTQSFSGFPWPRGSCRAHLAWHFHELDRPLPRRAAAGTVHVLVYHKRVTRMDKASQVLAQGPPVGVPRSHRAIADHSGVPHSTLHHRAHGRRSIEEKAESQRYLTPFEEKAVVDFILQMAELGTVPAQREKSNARAQTSQSRSMRAQVLRHPVL